MKRVLVTGISGFLGSHIALEGIRRGYQICGTVRSRQKAEETIQLFQSAGAETLPEIFFADLLSEAGWDEAVEGCSGIMHVASPFILEQPKNEDELIRPAVEGVKNVMAAARRQQVYRVVQTSSIVAIMHGHAHGKSQFSHLDWTNTEAPGVSAYAKSKTLAERVFWEFGKANSSFKLSTVNPGLVLGPVLNKDAGTSVEILVMLMKGKYPGVPRLGFPCVDVRDVAALHWDAFENDISIGKRYPAISESLWFREIAALLRDACPKYRRKIPSYELPDWFVRIFALFDKPTRLVLPDLGIKAEITGTAGQDLDFKPMSMRKSMEDSVDAILAMGIMN